MLLITYSSSRGETSVSSNQFKLRNTLKRSSPKEGAEPAPMLNLKQIFLPVVASCCLPSSWDHFPRAPREMRAGVHRHCVCSILVPRGTRSAVGSEGTILHHQHPLHGSSRGARTALTPSSAVMEARNRAAASPSRWGHKLLPRQGEHGSAREPCATRCNSAGERR